MGILLEQMTLKQRVFIIKSFYENRSDLLHVKSDYETAWGVSQTAAPNDGTIYNVVCLFEETGSVFYKEAYTNRQDVEEPLISQIDLKPEVEFITLDIKNEDNYENNHLSIKSAINNSDATSNDDNLLLVEFQEILKDETVSPSKEKIRKLNKCFSKTEKWNCVECNKTFKNTKEYQRHIKWHENKCDECGRNTRNLEEHIKKAHNREKNHIRPICGNRSRCNSKLNKHLTSNSTERSYICKICSRSFKSHHNLIIHEYIHKPKDEKQQFQCPKCPKAFPIRSCLTKHEMIHSDKKCICDICGKRFTFRTALTQHMSVHTGEKPFECEICKKSYSKKSTLKIHLRIHSGERPYKCEFCPKTFYDASTCKVHLRSHTGEEPYKCPFCSKTCKQGQNLRSHMRHIHFKEADPKMKINIK